MEPSKSHIKKTKIVATMGPACHNETTMLAMIRAGMNCARFNFSHGSHEEHFERLSLLRKAEKAAGTPIAIMLDTKGPEIRTTDVEDKDVPLEEGKSIAVTGTPKKTSEACVGLSYANIHKELQPGAVIKIADGSIVLEVKEVREDDLVCVVTKGGLLGSRKNVNVPGVKINLPSLLKKDIDDIHFAIDNNFDYIAASFIRSADDVMAIRSILSERGSTIRIIAKIENQEGLDNLESIIQMCDGIMVARGDLAEQIPSEEVPLKQKNIIRLCNENQKLAITATQMLQSMETSSTPTRAELTDVANAIFDGTDALMLSGESAKGKYPVEAIATMTRVALAVEKSAEFQEHIRSVFKTRRSDLLFNPSSAGESIIAATHIVADKSDAKVIACPSIAGNTPKFISCLRPTKQYIVATCHKEYVCRQLLLLWGVIPVLIKEYKTDKEMIDTAIEASRSIGLLKKNDKVLIVAGLPLTKPLMTNTLQVYFNGTVLFRGRQGIGPAKKGIFMPVANAAQIIKHAAENPSKDFIYYAPQLTYSMLPALASISALVVQQPAAVPLETIAKQYPNVSCVAHVDGLMFSDVKEGQEIILSGQEKLAYEP